MLEEDEKPKARRQKFEKIHENEIKALRATMANADGRTTIYLILRSTGWDQLSFTGNSQTFFNEGSRAVGVALRHRLITYCREDYNRMMSEHAKDGDHV